MSLPGIDPNREDAGQWYRWMERAMEIAWEVHRGQKDRHGVPYIFHPIRVMHRCRRVEEQLAALLHDVVEDSDLTCDDLRKEGFPEAVVQAVDHLTKREGETYEQLVERALRSELSRVVKIADIQDKLDVSRIPEMNEKEQARLKRYLTAYRKLISAKQPQTE